MSFRQWLGRLFGLVLITVFAIAVMIASGTNWLSRQVDSDDGTGENSTQLTTSPVLVIAVTEEEIPLTDRYSGLLEPLERFRLSFEISGRVERLGENGLGKPLDEGDTIRVGQVLAVLDQRGFEARLAEAQALAERAEKEWERAERLRQENNKAITDAELVQRQTDLRVAEAQVKLARKALEDATLVSKVDGVISQRMANAGESVAPQQVVFEVVQTDSLHLVVGVPESRITAVVDRLQEAKRQALRPDAKDLDDAEKSFQADVRLVGKDPRGRPWQPVRGTVVRVAQTADETSGLFDVEILIPNREQRLRAGQIAIAELVVDSVTGVQFPLIAAQFTDDRAFVFSVKAKGGQVVIPPQKSASYEAVRHELNPGSYVEQGTSLVVYDFPATNVVLRGQHRLVDGRPVKVLTAADSDVLGTGEQVPLVRLPDAGG